MNTISQINQKRILIVEDELLIGLELTDALFAAGAITLGPVTNFDDAEKLFELHSIDAAVLDFNIAGKVVTPLARRLSERKIPFIILTGEPALAQSDGLADLAEVCKKPISGNQVLERLSKMMTG